MPTVNIAPVGRQQFFDSNGDPLTGGQLFTYEAGTTTKEATYTTSAGSVAHTNPIDLDANGYTPSAVWLTDGQSYKFVLAPSGDTDPPASPIWTEDNIVGVNDVPVAGNTQWVASGFTPTFVSSTQFTVTGDQTATLDVGRRLQTTNSGGTMYSHISASVFTSLTTVTVVNDAGDALDSGLSAVNISVLSGTSHAVPRILDAEWTALGLGALGAANAWTGADTHAGAETYSGGTTHDTVDMDFTDVALNSAVHTEAAHATTADIWAGGQVCLLSGSAVTFTDIANAPQAGAWRLVVANAAHIFTDGATFEVDGNENYTCRANDVLLITAKTTSTFRVNVISTGDAEPVKLNAGAIVQRVHTQSTANTTDTNTIPIDSTIPQNTEGSEFLTQAITPTDTNNLLLIEANMNLTNSSASEYMIAALFQDSTAGALAAQAHFQDTSGSVVNLVLKYQMTAGTESETTFKIRCGQGSTGTCTMNTSVLGSVVHSTITVTEIKV